MTFKATIDDLVFIQARANCRGLDNLEAYRLAVDIISHLEAQHNPLITSDQISKTIQEVKPEEIIKPLPALDEISDDEILYWSSPYYDELQARKRAQTESRSEV